MIWLDGITDSMDVSLSELWADKDLESPSSTRLEALVPSRDSRARTRSPSQLCVCVCVVHMYWQLDKIEGVFERPSDEVIRELSRALRQALGVSLFGIDVIINNQTGQHAVIDINAFPGERRGRGLPSLAWRLVAVSAFPLGWPWEAQSSPRVARESWGWRSSHCRA